MSLRRLPGLLSEDPGLISVLGSGSATVAVSEPARPLLTAAVAVESERRPLLVAVPTAADAERLASDLTTWLGQGSTELFPAWETLPFERVSPGVETMGRRMRTAWRLRRGGEEAPRVVVAPVRALVQRIGPGATQSEPVVVRSGQLIESEELVARLIEAGYRREYQVEHRGELAVRGSIVDVFPSTADVPVRIDLWGDEVDRLSEFSVQDQRSSVDLEAVEIFGCRELIPTPEIRQRATQLVSEAPWGREQWERLAEGQMFDGMESWLPWLADEEVLLADLLGSDALVMLVSPRRLRDRAGDLAAEEQDLARSLARTWGAAAEAEDPRLPSLHLPFERVLANLDPSVPLWSLPEAPESPDAAVVDSLGWAPLHGETGGLFGQLRELAAADYRVLVAAEGAGSAERLVDLLAEQGLRAELREASSASLTEPGVHVVVASLARGAVLKSASLAVLTEAELTGRRRTHRRSRPRRRGGQAVFDDLRAGNLVVHDQHGVARYGGMVTRAIGGVERDYLLLEYRGDDRLYVPSDQVEVIRPYSGGDDPTLSRLGGSEWQRTKAKVRSEVSQIAQELVVLYQRRLATEGITFGPDTPWQREMEEAFGYEPTPDQQRAIQEVKADMASSHPMDRLLCGDVGFGKTEVALRAAFKAIQEGKQAAVLVPTTLLAQQHHLTFSERLASYPLRVEVLSRFLTATQARRVLEGVASGDVDLVVGTHRLLADDVSFKDLGLLVVDEEQRFGVNHKERIKSLRTNVDVLTLTATPIPRTLEMGLTGIRDLSLLQTPPAERQPILTYVGEQDDHATAEAIRRELLRDGQVFFVHNRVRDIERVADHIRALVPEARVAVAHGQMDEASLERVVMEFWEGAYDVLVCTTIIESGIDMPTVNTLVVNRADLLGLGQLHQLRGRVGRAGQRAYAYLFFPPDVSLSEEAYERLRTIGEATELGSGFRIAMRDLEIRGAGNLLGTGQSGHIASVGYDLYCQMVTEAVAELKGERPPEPVEITVEVPVDAHLPGDYVEREDLRVEAYRRLSAVTDDSEVDDVRAEWEDRYGPIPEPAATLLEVARLRAAALSVDLSEVTVARGTGIGGPRWTARLAPVSLRASAKVGLSRRYPKAVYKQDAGHLIVPVSSPRQAPAELRAAIDDLLAAPGGEAVTGNGGDASLGSAVS